MSKSGKKKRVLTPYEQRLHNNWLRRQPKQKATAEPATAPLSKEALKLHWQDQAALDEQLRRDAALAAHRRAQKKSQAKQRQQVDDWIKNNDKQVNVQALASVWEKTAAENRDKLLDVAVKYFAIADAGTQVNNVLRIGMAMESASLDMKDFTQTLIRHMRVDVNRVLLENSKLTKAQQAEILARVIAREFPTRDNRVTLPKGGSNTQTVLQNAMKNELRKYETEP